MMSHQPLNIPELKAADHSSLRRFVLRRRWVARREKDPKYEHLLDELLKLAERLEIEVRREYLGDIEAPAQSGLVHLRGKPILFLDIRLAPREAVETAASVLADFPLDDVYVKPAVRRLLEARENDLGD